MDLLPLYTDIFIFVVGLVLLLKLKGISEEIARHERTRTN